MWSRAYNRFLLIAIAFSIAFCATSTGLADAPATAKITLLYTNDVHGHLFPFDYNDLGRQLTNVGGAARRATLIRKLKAETGNSAIVMDAGDVFTRGPLDSLMGEPDFEVMNAVPYDVMTLGNNEFKASAGSESLNILRDRIKQANFAIVCANVFDRTSNQRLVGPYKVFNICGVKVAVIGLTTQRNSSNPQYSGVRVDDPIATAKQLVPDLRKQADFVVALTHLGVAQDIELATVPGIDVIIGGDSHTWLDVPLLICCKKTQPNWAIGGTLVCQDGEWGRTVGKLDLTLRKLDGDGCAIEAYSGSLIGVDASITPASDISSIIDKASAPFSNKVGKFDMPIRTEDAANWVAGLMRSAADAQVGIIPREDVEHGLDAKILTALDVQRMFPYVNQVVKITITGKQLRSFLANHPNAGMSGIAWAENDLYMGKNKVLDAQNYTVAIEDYFAKYDAALAGSQYVSTNKTTVDVVIQHLASLN